MNYIALLELVKPFGELFFSGANRVLGAGGAQQIHLPHVARQLFCHGGEDQRRKPIESVHQLFGQGVVLDVPAQWTDARTVTVMTVAGRV